MISNLILLTGEDDFRLRERLAFYKKAFVGKYPDAEVEHYDATTELSLLENAVLTPSLFGSRRLVICEDFWSVENFEKAQKRKFFERLPDFSETCTMISVALNLDKRKKCSKFLLAESRVESFENLSENQVWKWVEDFATKNQGKIAHTTVKKLIHRCGENLWNLSQEIKKLIAASDGGIITDELVETLTLPHPKVIIWGFLEAISQKNRSKALLFFRQLCFMGESVHQIFSMLLREIRIHAQINAGQRQGLSPKEIATQAALHPFVVQKTAPLSRNFDRKQIQKLYEELFQIDLGIKTGRIMLSTDDQTELELAVERFILNATK